jgi:hypothetical protein
MILILAEPVPAPLEAIEYRLPAQEVAPPLVANCRRGGGDEIVVCGRAGRYRLEELKPPAGAEAKQGTVIGHDLPFGRIEPLMETVVRSDGWVDKRIMVTLKMPF